jgi:predicted small lipoprotein YifL
MVKMIENTGMRVFLSLAIILLFAIFSLTACGKKSDGNSQPAGRAQSSPQAGAEAPPSDGVRRVTIAELQEAIGKGEAIAVDVRGTVEYNLGHIKGAISIPLGLINSRINELPRDKLIVTYCA